MVKKNLLFPLSSVSMLISQTHSTFAHEMWVISPEREQYWRAQPFPKMFSEPTWPGMLTLAFFVGIVIVALLLHYKVKPGWLVWISGQRQRYEEYIPLVLRLTAGWGLATSAYGYETRVGNQAFRHPTLFAPDLMLCGSEGVQKLSDFFVGPVWLVLPQAFIGALLILGLWVRAAAIGLIVLVLAGIYVFGMPMLAYTTLWIGVAVYIFARGAGPFATPCFGTDAYLKNKGIDLSLDLRHAQWFLRVMTGLNIIYLGVWFKVFQPNLAIGILTDNKVPFLSIWPEYSVFLMACVEITFGILFTFGIVIRFASIILFIAFFYFASYLEESYTLHMVYYGALIAFLLGGPGRLTERGLYSSVMAKNPLTYLRG